MNAALLLPGVLMLAAPGDWQVWTLTRTERVLREDPAGAGTSVHVRAARNEWRSFQVLMRAKAAVPGVTLEPGDLIGPGGAVIPARTARLFRQHQLYLELPTARNEAFRPGWYPDALIPFDHPVTRQPLPPARYRAVPFDLPAGETHGFWVDLYAPRNAPPGEYRGTYRLRAADGRQVPLSVTLTLWDFALPDTPTMHTAFGSPGARLRGYYEQRAREGKEPAPTDWAAVDEQCAELLARNRINAS
ncbi:MAG: hypothetical protein QHJ73_18085, partial [Armatimonadota bacterium]|nr:hypothetical protein [Armatimonadota bacterium]